MNGEERIQALKEAMRLLEEAADIIDGALRMSEMEHRCKGDSDEIRRIASSEEYGGSLANIIRDLEYGGKEQPCWTQPLVSPKNLFDSRKTYITDSYDEDGKRASDENLGVCEGKGF